MHVRTNLSVQRSLWSSRSFATTSRQAVTPVQQLPSWNLSTFREKAFIAAVPSKLPLDLKAIPQACNKWFMHDNSATYDLAHGQPTTTSLRPSFWSEHETTLVPLELTTTDASGSTTFHRADAPLRILLSHLSDPSTPDHSIYLAQCDLTSLPQALQSDLPTPSLVTSAGKGDIYSSSLWLGRPPTYTPLHRDPNPNLFLQLAGKKVIRLFPPEIGNAIFDHVQDRLAQTAGRASSASFRGEEMMQGVEKELLHQIVWGTEGLDLLHYAQEAHLALGEGLFIPKGWWHSVKGVGKGITASANWWFR